MSITIDYFIMVRWRVRHFNTAADTFGAKIYLFIHILNIYYVIYYEVDDFPPVDQ